MPVFNQDATLAMDHLVKIFVSRPDEPALGELHEDRLREHRARFPEDHITLFSNLEDFDKEKIDELTTFCQGLNITLLSLDSIEQEIQRDNTLSDQAAQLQLLALARTEIKTQEGCLAAASDILRALTPVAKVGFYSDLDFIKKATRADITSSCGLLVLGKASVGVDGKFNLHFNNCFLACDESRNNFLKYFRSEMLKRYTDEGDHIAWVTQCLKTQIFTHKDYAKATAVCKQDQEQLPHTIKFRRALKKVLDAQTYENALRSSVLYTSGPECLVDSFQAFIIPEVLDTKDVQAVFKQCNLNPNNPKDRQTVANATMKSLLLTPALSLSCFENESDASWIPSVDKTKARIADIKAKLKARQALSPEPNLSKMLLPLYSVHSSGTPEMRHSIQAPVGMGQEQEAGENAATMLFIPGKPDPWDQVMQRSGVSPAVASYLLKPTS